MGPGQIKVSRVFLGLVSSIIFFLFFGLSSMQIDQADQFLFPFFSNFVFFCIFLFFSFFCPQKKIKVILPQPNDAWKPREKNQTMLTHYKENNMERLIVGRNKRPCWDEAAGGHTLNFRGRVTEKSVKNFQIKCSVLSGEKTVLQFGRVVKKITFEPDCFPDIPDVFLAFVSFQVTYFFFSNLVPIIPLNSFSFFFFIKSCVGHFNSIFFFKDKNRFTMDFGHPLSPLQAFAICLASLDGKVSDSGALHGMKRGVRRVSSGASWLGGKISSTFSRKSKKGGGDGEGEGGEGGGEGGEGRERFVEGRGGRGGKGGETQEEISGDDEDLDHETLPGEMSGGQTSGESKSELSGASKTMDSMPIIPAGNVREIENKEEGGSGGSGGRGSGGGGSRRTGRHEGAIGTVVAVVATGNVASDEEDEPIRPPRRPNRSSK